MADPEKLTDGQPAKNRNDLLKNGSISSRAWHCRRRFLDHFPKDNDSGWDCEVAVRLHLCRSFSSEFELRKEQHWPLTHTRWETVYLSVGDAVLIWETTSVTFDASERVITFLSTKLTGPLNYSQLFRLVLKQTADDPENDTCYETRLFVQILSTSPPAAKVAQFKLAIEFCMNNGGNDWNSSR